MQKALGETLTVSQFNSLIKEVLSELGIFRVRGEITELTITKNKGLSLTISDGKANLRVGGYAPTVKGLDLVEKDMEVVVEGVADLYVNYGSFSLKAFSVEAVGEGALGIAYRKLKEKLENEGLFAEEHKQELPQFITKIALLTGKDSAAYSDFIKILKENNVGIEVLYYPVLVQGDKSVRNITDAFNHVKTQEGVEVVVLTRGGGSLEDLKSFNDEDLARLVFSSAIPVIAGVGHERDESVCDYTADIRASTPSQAAYYIAQRNEEFLNAVDEKGRKIESWLREQLSELESKAREKILSVEHSVHNILNSYNQKIEMVERIVNSYDIEKTLKRGFSIVKKGKTIVKSVKDIKENDEVTNTLADGQFRSKINYLKHYPSSNGEKEKK